MNHHRRVRFLLLLLTTFTLGACHFHGHHCAPRFHVPRHCR